jgi:hypothetical protein
VSLNGAARSDLTTEQASASKHGNDGRAFSRHFITCTYRAKRDAMVQC